jgi:hypothetical protein
MPVKPTYQTKGGLRTDSTWTFQSVSQHARSPRSDAHSMFISLSQKRQDARILREGHPISYVKYL